jgi:hypothetical protein
MHGQHAAVLLAGLALGVVLFWAAFRYGRHAGPYGRWGLSLAATVLPFVGMWPLFGHSSGWAPRLGLGIATAASLLSIAATELPRELRLSFSALVLALAVVALVARPRLNRQAVRLCAAGMAVITVLVFLASG